MKEEQYIISSEDSKIIGMLKAIMAVMVVFIHAHYDGINLATGNIVFEQPRWFDITKCILSDAIPSCAVPGFFIIAAILLYKKSYSWKVNIVKKTRTLLIPYFIVCTFWIVFYACAQLSPAIRQYFSNPDRIVANWEPIDYLKAYLGFEKGKVVYPIYGPLWFVRDLFVLNILSPIIKKCIDKCPKLYLTAILLMMLFNIDTHLFFLKNTALFFFSMGYYFVKYGIHFSDIKIINYKILSVTYLIFLILYLYFMDSQWKHVIALFSINIGLLWWTYVAYYISGLKGKLHDVMSVLEVYNFTIYIFHQIPITILEKILFKILPKGLVFIVIEYFAVIVIILLGCVAFSKVLERYTPRFFGLLSGGRA